MTSLLIGCPVAHREWIIRHWADHALTAARHAGFEPAFVLAAHPEDPTPRFIAPRSAARFDVVPVDLERAEDRRDWYRPGRFSQMAEIRNTLLRHVRAASPDMFLSLDSDILLHPDALTHMVGMLEHWDAAGSACFLSKAPKVRRDGQIARGSWNLPNAGKLSPNHQLMRRWEAGAPDRRVDVLMAIKLMSPAAYAVDYAYHFQGEDVGWALNARVAGLRFGWTCKVVSKHVMESHCGAHLNHDPGCEKCSEPISRIDPRCGY